MKDQKQRLGIKEFMKILIDEYSFEWKELGEGYEMLGFDSIYFTIERRAKITQKDYDRLLSNAVSDADKLNRYCALAYRQDRQDWRVSLDLGFIDQAMDGINASFDVDDFVRMLALGGADQ